MIHLVSLNPALDLFFDLEKPLSGKIGKVTRARVEPGGKALNAARFLKKFNIPSSVWLGAGGGNHPTHVLYRALLAQENLKVSFLNQKTPIRFNLVTRTNREAHKYNHPGFPTESRGFSRLLAQVKKNDTVVLTGRLPQGVPETLYVSWIKTLNRRGVQTIIDTSGKPLLYALKAGPCFFKSNLFEISEALDRPIQDLKQALAFVKKNRQRKGFQQGALTDGASGALVWNEGECYRVQPPKISSPLVVGAGDGFLAGYLYGSRLGNRLNVSAAWAGAFGAAVAASGIQGFTQAEAARFHQKVTVRQLK